MSDMKLTNDDLIHIIQSRRANSIGPDNADITSNWSDALDRYHGRPFGDEEPGFSSVTTRDLSETIDTAMPIIIRILLQSGNIAEFTPTSSESEALAQIQSDYANYVFMKDNDGFLVSHDAIKDALMLKNGYIKHWFDVQKKVKQKKYKNVTPDDLQAIFAHWRKRAEKVDVVSQDESDDGTFTSVTLKITEVVKKIACEAVPPEELNISGSCRGSLEDADFIEHKPPKNRSDLIEMGLPKDWVDKLEARTYNTNIVSQQQDTGTNDVSFGRDDYNKEDEERTILLDKSLDSMDYREVYIRVDYDGDGISELRKIITVNNQIPPGEEWNEPIDIIPFSGGTPKRMPHRHSGESFYDDLKDLIEINTVLERQLMDNVYRTVNAEWIINKKCYLPDWQQTVPGGFKRVDTEGPVSDHAVQTQPTPIVGHILPVLNHIRERKDKRASVDDSAAGVSSDVLKQATEGAIMESLSLAAQKAEMVTRMLAETLFKPTIKNIIRLAIKHQDFERVVSIRGEDVKINPMFWDEDMQVTVKVGIGTGNSKERYTKLMIISQLQDKLKADGLIGPDQEYSLFNDIVKAIGEETPEKYAINPRSPEFTQNKQYIMGLAAKAQQQGNPLAEAEKIKGEFKLQSDQMSYQYKAQIDQLKETNKMQSEQMKEMNKMQIAQMQESHKHEMDTLLRESEDRQAELNRQHEKALTIFKEEMANMRDDKAFDAGKPGIGAELDQI